MFFVSNLFKNVIKFNQKFESQIKCAHSVNEFIGGKKLKKKSIIKEFISEARERDFGKLVNQKLAINFDVKIDDKFINDYNSIKAKMKINSYSIFISDKFDKSKNRIDEFTRLSKTWQSIDCAEKKLYIERARQIKKNANQELKSLLSKLSNDEMRHFKKKIKLIKKARLDKLRKIRIRKQRIMNKIPKKPPTAFSLFIKDLIKKNQIGFKEAVAKGSKIWKELSQCERNAYLDESRNLSKEYKEKFKEWENRMIVEGKVKLISSKTKSKVKLKLLKMFEKSRPRKVTRRIRTNNRRKKI